MGAVHFRHFCHVCTQKWDIFMSRSERLFRLQTWVRPARLWKQNRIEKFRFQNAQWNFVLFVWVERCWLSFCKKMELPQVKLAIGNQITVLVQLCNPIQAWYQVLLSSIWYAKQQAKSKWSHAWKTSQSSRKLKPCSRLFSIKIFCITAFD